MELNSILIFSLVVSIAASCNGSHFTWQICTIITNTKKNNGTSRKWQMVPNGSKVKFNMLNRYRSDVWQTIKSQGEKTSQFSLRLRVNAKYVGKFDVWQLFLDTNVGFFSFFVVVAVVSSFLLESRYCPATGYRISFLPEEKCAKLYGVCHLTTINSKQKKKKKHSQLVLVLAHARRRNHLSTDAMINLIEE